MFGGAVSIMGETNYKEGAIVLIVIVILAGLALAVLSASAKTTVQAEIKEEGLVEFKLYEDGVTYLVKSDGGFLYDVQGVNILVGDDIIDCVPDGYHKNQYMTPLCLEIILRHELDRRGL